MHTDAETSPSADSGGLQQPDYGGATAGSNEAHAGATEAAVDGDGNNALDVHLHAMLAIDCSSITTSELEEVTRKNAETFLQEICRLPRHISDSGVYVVLPPAPKNSSFVLPRAHPWPRVHGAETRWEAFAREKNIEKRKRSRLVWSETAKDWLPRWGPQSAAAAAASIAAAGFEEEAPQQNQVLGRVGRDKGISKLGRRVKQELRAAEQRSKKKRKMKAKKEAEQQQQLHQRPLQQKSRGSIKEKEADDGRGNLEGRRKKERGESPSSTHVRQSAAEALSEGRMQRQRPEKKVGEGDDAGRMGVFSNLKGDRGGGSTGGGSVLSATTAKRRKKGGGKGGGGGGGGGGTVQDSSSSFALRKETKQRKLHLAKQQLREVRNQVEAAANAGRQHRLPPGVLASVGRERAHGSSQVLKAWEKPSLLRKRHRGQTRDELREVMRRAQISTASFGRHDPLAKNEKKEKQKTHTKGVALSLAEERGTYLTQLNRVLRNTVS